MNSAPPAPQVEHLPTIFRKIRSGEYRVPPFQREFVWTEKQVIELLESVYRGFPIGSVLMWKVQKKVFRAANQPNTGFPQVIEHYPASFVLDGVQRLSTLYGVFNADSLQYDARLDVIFDLENEEFLPRRGNDGKKRFIALQSIFNTKAFLNEQRRLSNEGNEDVILDRAVILLSTFQEYMLPMVSISNPDPDEVVRIFERINSTGTRLGVVDFMRALTWSDDFDLSEKLADIREGVLEKGFVIDEETILKGLGIVCDLKPLPDVLIGLRSRSAAEMHDAVQRLEHALDNVTQFVTLHTGIENADALPYEAQWLFLIRLCNDGVDLNAIAPDLMGWIRATSFSEALQGRPDHALARMIDDQAALIYLGLPIRAPRVEIGLDEIIAKRFLRGKAMTVAFIEMLVRRGVFETNPLRVVPYEEFVPLLSIELLNETFHREFSSSRTIGNVLYLPFVGKRRPSSALDHINGLLITDPKLEKFLSAQFVTPEVLSLIKAGNYHAAMTKRVKAIAEYACS